jgi:hypothetical protein
MELHKFSPELSDNSIPAMRSSRKDDVRHSLKGHEILSLFLFAAAVFPFAAASSPSQNSLMQDFSYTSPLRVLGEFSPNSLSEKYKTLLFDQPESATLTLLFDNPWTSLHFQRSTKRFSSTSRRALLLRFSSITPGRAFTFREVQNASLRPAGERYSYASLR